MSMGLGRNFLVSSFRFNKTDAANTRVEYDETMFHTVRTGLEKLEEQRLLENLGARHDQVSSSSISGSIQCAARFSTVLQDIIKRTTEQFDGSLAVFGDVESILEDVFQDDDKCSIEDECKDLFDKTKVMMSGFSAANDVFEETKERCSESWSSLTETFGMFDFDSTARSAVREVTICSVFCTSMQIAQ